MNLIKISILKQITKQPQQYVTNTNDLPSENLFNI